MTNVSARQREHTGSENRSVRLGFLGTGWIGANRMKAVVASGTAEARLLYDPNPDRLRLAREYAPEAEVADSFEAMLNADLDGIVIATPSAMHAEQAKAALSRGYAVFCQKPLGRTRRETEEVVDTARGNNKLLGVDFSYRNVRAFRSVHDVIQSGKVGHVYSADLVFHNAYGPDKEWFYDPRRSGGGCVMDLGIHLVDMALWCLGFPEVESVQSRLFRQGKRLDCPEEYTEDYATATLDLASGANVRITCSWNLHAGRDAVISACFWGEEGGVSVRNIAGSFYDFMSDCYRRTTTYALSSPPDDWGGRTLVQWARRLAQSDAFDENNRELVRVASVLDEIYGRRT